MKETRIVVLNSLKNYCVDQKYNVKMFLNSQQGIVDFYRKMGFVLDQVDRTKIDETYHLLFSDKKAPSGLTPLVMRKRSDETIVVLSRDISESFDRTFEDEIFNKLKNNYEEFKKIHEKFDYWILFSAIFIIVLYGIIPYIILSKKKKTQLNNNLAERKGIYSLLDKYNGYIFNKYLDKSNDENHSTIDSFDKLNNLKKMLDAGLITQDDYEQKKDEILNTI